MADRFRLYQLVFARWSGDHHVDVVVLAGSADAGWWIVDVHPDDHVGTAPGRRVGDRVRVEAQSGIRDALIIAIDGDLVTAREILSDARRVGDAELDNPAEVVKHTGQRRRYPWPAGAFVQGGTRGLSTTSNEWTAYVEVSVGGTFLRGEGATVADAEDACWHKYQVLSGCSGHGPYEARGYTNGAGFCVGCGTWFPHVPPATTSS